MTEGVTFTTGATLKIATLGAGAGGFSGAFGETDGDAEALGVGAEGAGIAGGVAVAACFGALVGESVSVVSVNGKSVITSPSCASFATSRKEASAGSDNVTSPDMVLKP